MKKEKVLTIIGLMALAIVVVFLGAIATELIWDWLMPDLFGLPEITYWQALGLQALAKLLFYNGSSSSD